MQALVLCTQQNIPNVTMDAETPMILIAGGSEVGKKSLIRRITSRSDTEQSLPCSWNIDTKYYVAETRINAHRCGDGAARELPSAEALILTVDATDQQSFEAARAWHAQHCPDDTEISLLVMNQMDRLRGPDGDIRRGRWHSEAQDWCCEHYFEYIEASASCLRHSHAL